MGVRSEEEAFDAADGRRLFERRWVPAEGEPKAAVVIIHGYAEHSGRYAHAGEALAWAGYAVSAVDLRGHGLSDGPRASVQSFAEYLDDLRATVARVRVRTPGRPLFVLGHSMGGAILTLWLAVDRPDVRGAVLSGAVLSRGAPSLLQRVIMWVGRVTPRLPLTKLDAALVSRDTAVVRAYEADPLVYHGRMCAGLIAAMMRAVRRIERDAHLIGVPLLILHGADDGLVTPEGSRWLHEEVASRDKTLRVYPRLHHEILNEPEREMVVGEIVAWLDARVMVAAGGGMREAGGEI